MLLLLLGVAETSSDAGLGAGGDGRRGRQNCMVECESDGLPAGTGGCKVKRYSE